jgi:hypothetical protein
VRRGDGGPEASIGAGAQLARVAVVAIALAAVASCSDADPRFGDPSAIKGKRVPGVAPADFFSGGYDPNDPPPPAKDPSQVHADLRQVVLTPETRCFDCHGGAGPGQPAAAAGYVAVKGGTSPAPFADVALVSGEGRFAGKTGKDGFFWIPAGPSPPAPGGRVAVRDADGRTGEMKQTLPSGACTSSSCHGPKEAAGVVVVPE